MALSYKTFIFAYYLMYVGTIIGIILTNCWVEKVSTYVWLGVNQYRYVYFSI